MKKIIVVLMVAISCISFGKLNVIENSEIRDNKNAFIGNFLVLEGDRIDVSDARNEDIEEFEKNPEKRNSFVMYAPKMIGCTASSYYTVDKNTGVKVWTYQLFAIDTIILAYGVDKEVVKNKFVNGAKKIGVNF